MKSADVISQTRAPSGVFGCYGSMWTNRESVVMLCSYWVVRCFYTHYNEAAVHPSACISASFFKHNSWWS